MLKPPPGCPDDSVVLQFPVAHEFAGLRLDRFIQLRIPRLSRSRANAIVRACAYRPDGRRRKPGDLVVAGEMVLLVRTRFKEPEAPRDFEILYEDDDVCVIHKPAGLPVHPSATYHRNTLSYILKERYTEAVPRITHRLDRETSGVIICARHLEAERHLKAQFEGRKVRKEYLAMVRGIPDPAEGLIDLAMRSATEGLHMLMEVCASEQGSPAQTEYELLQSQNNLSLVRLAPRTGRQHQLRVHLAAKGHPIVGDKLYGPEGCEPFLEYIETGMTPALVKRLGHERHALHAHRLWVTHPTRHEPMEFVAPLPADLEALWQQLPLQI